MRDRLIELIRCAEVHPVKGVVITVGSQYSPGFIADIADNLLANGVIVPPCKVGDTVYKTSVLGEITELKIKGFDCGIATEPYNIIPIENFGKTVFLTKEEAEQALKERE